MKYLDLAFTDPARNLACDEALLDFCEAHGAGEVLRVWEPAGYFIVVGYSNKVSSEVNIAACNAKGIPILRRFTGGGAVLQGPGCMNYALVIRNDTAGSSRNLVVSYEFVLRRHQRLFTRLIGRPVQIEGTSDLTVGGKKISGNSQHRKRRYSLFHGTFLLNFDLTLVGKYLPMPSRQPDYRLDRPHEDFLINASVDTSCARTALRDEWNAYLELDPIPFSEIERLAGERYGRRDWNFKF